MAETVSEAASAKLNLALHVTGRRADGYHSLEMLVAFADLTDELEAAPAARDTLTITGPFAAALGNSESNLVLKALAAFRARWPGALPAGLSLRLHKNLPVAAGLGGQAQLGPVGVESPFESGHVGRGSGIPSAVAMRAMSAT